MTYRESLEANFHHFESLNKLMQQYGWPIGGGSYLVSGQNLEYNPVTFSKQELYYNIVRDTVECDLIEIGVYAGHSMLIALMANPSVSIIGIDPGYPFTRPCVEYLSEKFPLADIYLMEENSHDALPKIGGWYEIIHLDGNHDPVHIAKDIELCKRLCRQNTMIVIDDWDGVSGSVSKEALDMMDVIQVADCPNPNALCRFK